MKAMNMKFYAKSFTLLLLGAFLMTSCKTKKIPSNPLDKFMALENPYSNANRSGDYIIGYGDSEGGLKDTIVMCYELLDDKDKDLRPIIGDLAKTNPENEEIQFISAKNHLNLENYAKALEGFSKLMNSNEYKIKDQSRYYYSLVSVYLDSTDSKAIAILEEIGQDKKSEFRKMAIDVISFL